MTERVRVGAIGWNHPEWRGLVYPAESREDQLLHEYAARFSTVEVSASHYKMPAKTAAAGWVDETPGRFEMSLKVPDWILKKKPEDGLGGALEAFLRRLDPLREAGKLGVLVAQYAPFLRYGKDGAILRGLIESLPVGERWAVELRHESWWNDDTYKMLSDAKVGLVWSVVEAGRTPPVITSDHLYLRLFRDHTLDAPYDRVRRTEDEELAYWAARIKDEGASAKMVRAMVSNHLEGYAPASVVKLSGLLGLDVPSVDASGRKHTRQTQLM